MHSVGFWSHKRSKRTNKVFIKSQKIPVPIFIAINQAKEQGTNVVSRCRTHSVGFWSLKPSKRTRSKCLIKAQKLAVLVFEVRNKVKEPETKFLLSHGNLSF